LAIDLITLIEGNLHDIVEMVYDVTNVVLHDFMQEDENMLGALKAQLQEL